jgi:ribosomal protein L37AE/L43A
MIRKYANATILEVKTSNTQITADSGKPGEALSKFSKLSASNENDGYLYVRCRAISSRVNKNNDGWPAAELKKAYKSFLNKPIFVDHNNDDPSRTRGVIISSVLHEEDEKTSALDPYYATAPDNHKPPTWIELLLEVDAKSYPKLADAVRSGAIDSVSMGCNVNHTDCSVCGNTASEAVDFCEHVQKKGLTFEITSDNGEKIRKKAYEDCYGIGFFEISFVFDPADETALISEKEGKVAALKEAVSVPSGQRGINYNYTVVDSRGMRHDAYDLQDALTLAKELCQKWMGGCKIEDAQGKPVDYMHFLTLNSSIKEAWDDPNEVVPFDELCPRCGSGNWVRTEHGDPQMPDPMLDVECQDCGWHGKEGELKLANVAERLASYVKEGASVEDLVDSLMSPVNDDGGLNNYIPQSEKTTAPPQVDTLQDDTTCPKCHSADLQADPDGIQRCQQCGYVAPPEPVNNPDLSEAKDVREQLKQQEQPPAEVGTNGNQTMLSLPLTKTI